MQYASSETSEFKVVSMCRAAKAKLHEQRVPLTWVERIVDVDQNACSAVMIGVVMSGLFC